MSAAAGRSRLIAFCGIDGAGKTSLVELARHRSLVPGAVYLKKATTQDVERIKRYHPRRWHDGRDFASGSFAQWIATATVMDFLQYYETAIEPLLDRERPLVLDRFTPCYAAYLHSTGSRLPLGRLFTGLRRPDLVVSVEVAPEVALERCQRRGTSDNDESLIVMRRFAAAYRQVFAAWRLPVLHLDNAGPLEETYRALAAGLLSWRQGIEPEPSD